MVSSEMRDSGGGAWGTSTTPSAGEAADAVGAVRSQLCSEWAIAVSAFNLNSALKHLALGGVGEPPLEALNQLCDPCHVRRMPSGASLHDS